MAPLSVLEAPPSQLWQRHRPTRGWTIGALHLSWPEAVAQVSTSTSVSVLNKFVSDYPSTLVVRKELKPTVFLGKWSPKRTKPCQLAVPSWLATGDSDSAMLPCSCWAFANTNFIQRSTWVYPAAVSSNISMLHAYRTCYHATRPGVFVQS